jgi:acetylxylan esterase
MARFSTLLTLLAATTSFFGSSHARAMEKRAALTQVTGFSSSNPSNTLMYIYVPTKLAANPPIIVAIHFCTGTAQAYYSSTPYAQLADQYGFIVVYPQSPYSGTCWDVSSKAALTHNGAGSDSKAIADMVTYTLSKYSGDASKVFVTGSSSGAMMTNVMAATYPELFAAATAYSGVPAGCFMSASGQVDAWNSTCAQGNSHATSQQWANVVNAMYPGYTGARPRFQVYHGSIDTVSLATSLPLSPRTNTLQTLYPNNYQETVKEWTGVFSYDSTKPAKVQSNFPKSGYTTDSWGIDAANPLGKVQGIYALNVGHTVPVDGTQDMMWFQLGPYAVASGSAPASSSTKAVATSTKAAVPTTAPVVTSTKAASPTTAPVVSSTKAAASPTGASVAHWGQCGGYSCF